MINILLADDCRTMYAQVRLVFLRKAHIVQATKLHVIISRLRARPDLVLLDLRLGGFDAADVMPHVRTHGSPPVVLLSEATESELRSKVVLLGAQAYCLKSELARLPSIVYGLSGKS